ncbi:N-acetylmuramoyl-L-alanine amidase family protein [Deinococcus yavapaiensis]|uniref:N-acetylmuramoyl-L-alanine amidase n=1 Tax=Deinococcus yavapaiensis KR-236 TaxID=694435 RepID=A0A318SMF9_9DEIO|nr:N-acetylmuramoyl-L-alanine amidase [Deinococcus yavapaiensis]PYE55863.1 N-acetylmuramoyl-L-alanine amidase [Deinococcus yavapaiensis KR-236]
MPPRLLASLAAWSFALYSSSLAAPDVFVAYPPNASSVAFDHVLFEGSVTPGATLSVDGQLLPVDPDGLFIAWLPLRPGLNVLKLQSELGGERSDVEWWVTSKPDVALPAVSTALRLESIEPRASVEVFDLSGSLAARTITIRFHGAPGGTATYRAGSNAERPMTERLDVPGLYEAKLILGTSDRFVNLPVTLALVGRDGQRVTATAPGTLSARPGGPRNALVVAPDVGMGVNSYLTAITDEDGWPIVFSKAGQSFPVVARVGDRLHVALEAGRLGWLPSSAASLSSAPAAPLTAHLSSPSVRALPGGSPSDASFEEVRLPLTGRAAFEVVQPDEGNFAPLRLRLFGTSSEADTIEGAGFVRTVDVTRDADTTNVTLHFAGSGAWGYTTTFDGNDLVVRVRVPPILDDARPLSGRRVVLDAGHGGRELGGAGSLRVPEKDLVLPVTLRLAQLLRERGATVFLTRQTDVTVPLYDRALFAEAQNADVLLSIHANALPDGQPPACCRGAGAYYFQPGARRLARTLVDAVVAGVPGSVRDTQEDGSGVFRRNFALARPSTQLSVLMELAYLTDRDDLRLLMSGAGREAYARSLADGLEAYFRASAQTP